MTDVVPSATVSFGYIPALYPLGEPSSLRIVRMDQRDGQDWRQAVGDGGECHLIWERGNALSRAWCLFQLTRQLADRCSDWQLIGLHGTVGQPAMVASLQRNILHYIYTEAFRGSDSPVRLLLKRCASYLPSWLTWNGPLVLIASANPVAYDRFVLLTEDREIAFLFRPGAPTPWAVCKRGDSQAVAAECRNHKRALQLLGDSVPALLNEGDNESLIQEALPERFLGNIVAGAWRDRRGVFVREALAHMAFCVAVYRRFVQGASLDIVPVNADEVADLLEGMGEFLQRTSEADQLKAAVEGFIGLSLPRVAQHCDFCVRNVLVVGGERDRVLIDWEDFQERCWPLADYVLLRLSLKEVYSDLLSTESVAMEDVTELSDRLTAMETELMTLLNLDQEAFHAAELLSLAYLCGQNVRKGRSQTANSILRELLCRLSADSLAQSQEEAR